ncbi:hypothetical protein E4U41_001278 [Claviceps citrina]|nr:hypothetical protein E4U41_001278 [Claviceps citrina]
MVRPTLITSFLATAYAAVAAAGKLPGGFIVELEDGHDHSAVINHLDGEATTRMVLDHELFKGVSFTLHDVAGAKERAKKVADLPAVKNIWPINVIEPAAADFRVVSPANIPTGGRAVARGLNKTARDTFSPHVMTQIDMLHAKGITGKGIRVAIIDTGIDYTHEALGHCFGKGCLVSVGYDFVGDGFDGTNTPVPDDDPMDCFGHGTHVAGILAAQENPLGFTGAAPGVTLGAYRVFGCSGRTTSDVVLAAMARAYADGANIVTASISHNGGWSEDPWSVMATRLTDKGIPVTISAGNEGDYGLFRPGSLSIGQKTTSVASFDNIVAPLLNYHSTYNINGGRKIDFQYTPGETANEDSAIWGVSMPLYATSLDQHVADDACKPLPSNTPDLSKYIVLVRRGGCLFDEKTANLVAKGAQYIMFYNDEPAGTITVVLDQPDVVKATAMVTSDVGVTWVRLLKAGRKLTVNVLSITEARASVSNASNNITGGAVSTFSSWGPSYEMDFKPQIGAPGGNILSTLPKAMGSYGVKSGTSMSCPLVAGIIALISEVRGKMEPQAINDLLSSTAIPSQFNDGTNTFGELAPAPQQGGGLVQAYDAAYAKSLLSPSSLSFNDTDHFATKLNFTLTNKGRRTITYKLDQVSSLTMYTLDKDAKNPMGFPNEAVNSQAVLSFSQNSITLPPGHSASVGVTAQPATQVDAKRLALWSGYVTINGTDGSVLSLPYQGLTGSLRKTKVLQPDQTFMTRTDDVNQTRVADNFVYAVPPAGKATEKDVLPMLYTSLALGSSNMHVDVVPMGPGNATNTTIGELFGSPYPWNMRGPTQLAWDGQLNSGSYAPAGKYQLVVRVLRIFGDATKRADWDVAKSQPFVLKYKQ